MTRGCDLLILKIKRSQPAAAPAFECLNYLDVIGGFFARLIFFQVIRNFLTFFKGTQSRPLERGSMHEHICTVIVGMNKAKTLRSVIKTHCSRRHIRLPSLIDAQANILTSPKHQTPIAPPRQLSNLTGCKYLQLICQPVARLRLAASLNQMWFESLVKQDYKTTAPACWHFSNALSGS